MNFKQYILREQEESELRFSPSEHSKFEIRFYFKKRLFEITTSFMYDVSYRIVPNINTEVFPNLKIENVNIHGSPKYRIMERDSKDEIKYKDRDQELEKIYTKDKNAALEFAKETRFLKQLTAYKFINFVKEKKENGDFNTGNEYFYIEGLNGFLRSLSNPSDIDNIFNNINN